MPTATEISAEAVSLLCSRMNSPEEVRLLSRVLGLPIPDKPANPFQVVFDEDTEAARQASSEVVQKALIVKRGLQDNQGWMEQQAARAKAIRSR